MKPIRRREVILRFLHRYAVFIAIVCGLAGYRLILPDNSPWWLELGVALGITFPISLLLHKDGVTRHTTKR